MDDDLILAGEDDLAGDDEMGDEELGIRLPRIRRRRRPNARARAARAAQARRGALDAYQPDARGDALDQMVPFTAGTFTAAVTTLNLTANPQRKFMLRRLVISVGRVGATALTALVTVTALTVGADPQFVSGGGIPVEMFAFNAVGVRLKPNAARPGITIFLNLAQAGVGGVDTISVSAAGIGPSVG